MNGPRAFHPHRRVRRLLDLDPASLSGYRAVLLDYDNTLAAWRHAMTPETVAWLQALPVPAYVLSNGNPERIRSRMEPVGVRSRGRCSKPFTGKIARFLSEEGIDPRQCVLIGDNLITDIWTGNRLGCATILVEPMSRREHPATLFWRFLELLAGRGALSGGFPQEKR